MMRPTAMLLATLVVVAHGAAAQGQTQRAITHAVHFARPVAPTRMFSTSPTPTLRGDAESAGQMALVREPRGTSPAKRADEQGSPESDLSFLSETERTPQEDESIVGLVWQLVAAVLVVMLVCGFVVTRRSLRTPPTTGGEFSLLESLPLPRRPMIYLLDVRGCPMVLAADAGGVKSLVRLSGHFDSLLETTSAAEAEACST